MHIKLYDFEIEEAIALYLEHKKGIKLDAEQLELSIKHKQTHVNGKKLKKERDVYVCSYHADFSVWVNDKREED